MARGDPVNWAGALGHAFAAAAFLVLAAVLLAGWRGRAAGAKLILAAAVTSAASGILALDYSNGGVNFEHLAVLDLFRFCAWIAVLGGLAASAGVAPWLVRTAYGLAVAAIAIAAVAWTGAAAAGRLTMDRSLVASGVLLPVLGVLLLEQIYRNSHAQGRRALRPLFVGVGGMLLFDLFMYSEAPLAAGVSPEALAVRGFVYAACVPAIALAARRNPAWSLDIFVSRQVVFYSTTFLVIGLYLVLMSAGGYLITLYGQRWSEGVQAVFFAGAALVLFALLASDSARVRLRVFLNKHFYRNRYDYRVEWLRFVRALEADADEPEARTAMIRAVAQIVASHFGTLWVRSDDRRRLILATHWSDGGVRTADFASLDVQMEFVEFLEHRQWIVDLDELKRAPDVYQNLRLPESLAVPHDLQIFVPLMHGGQLVGLLGLGRPDAPFQMNYEDRDLLKTVGRHVGAQLAQIEADRRLTESRQFEAYSRLTAFLMHDLKNLVAQLSLVVGNAERHRRNPAFVDDAIDTIKSSTDRMTRLVEQLQRGEVRSPERPIVLREILERVVARTVDRSPAPTLTCPDPAIVVTGDPERLTMSIEHIVRNGQDATGADGAVSVRLAQSGDRAVIQIADTGTGMSAEFIRDRLFKPFDSTKGSKGMGIGAYQVRDYVWSIRGDISVSSSPGSGTVFSISLPIAAAER